MRPNDGRQLTQARLTDLSGQDVKRLGSNLDCAGCAMTCAQRATDYRFFETSSHSAVIIAQSVFHLLVPVFWLPLSDRLSRLTEQAYRAMRHERMTVWLWQTRLRPLLQSIVSSFRAGNDNRLDSIMLAARSGTPSTDIDLGGH